jgi:hypothetical protein
MFAQCDGEVGAEMYIGMRHKLMASSMLSCFKYKLIDLLSPQLKISGEGLSVSNKGLVVNTMLGKEQATRTSRNKRQLKSKTGAKFPFKIISRFVTKIRQPRIAARVKISQGRSE